MDVEISFARNIEYRELRARLGSGGAHRALADLLDEAARVGQQSAEIYAPERARRLKRKLESVPANRDLGGDLEARVGVGRVHEFPGRLGLPVSEGAEMYPLYVHEGTGLFGAFHRMIRPRRAKRMRFPGRTGIVYAKAVQGQQPQPYMKDAFEDVTSYVRARLDATVDEIFGRG